MLIKPQYDCVVEFIKPYEFVFFLLNGFDEWFNSVYKIYTLVKFCSEEKTFFRWWNFHEKNFNFHMWFDDLKINFFFFAIKSQRLGKWPETIP